MSEPFLGEIRAVGFNFAPRGWAMCNGQLMSITQNMALFSILGTFYGGNGTSTFALPDLQARFPLGAGATAGLTPSDLGRQDGTTAVTLTTVQMPPHTHFAQVSTAPGSASSPLNAIWAQPHFGRVTDQTYATSGGTAPMAATAIDVTGDSQPHNNMPPYLGLNFIIALAGIFPPRG
jgi:microcystin-dependent protein